MRDARFRRENREEHKTDFVVVISRAKTNILNPNESNIPKTNEYSPIFEYSINKPNSTTVVDPPL